MGNNFLKDKELNIFLTNFDGETKVGSVQLNEGDLKSEADLIVALQRAMKNLDDGMYTAHPTNALFARFKMINNNIPKLERLSQNTGIIMPCWNHFKI